MRDTKSEAGRTPGEPAPENLFWHDGKVTPSERAAHFGHPASTVWLTGLSGAGKSTLAYELDRMLLAQGHSSFVLDGDNVRHGLNRDLGFSARDRGENIRRVAEVARLMNQAGLIVICAFISPYRADRAMAADIIGAGQFIEVHVSTSTAVCEARDTKGLYAKARAGQLPEFTGVSSPYEAPLRPALALDTGAMALTESAAILYQYVVRGFATKATG